MAAEVLPEELMNAVLGKLYDVLCNGDDVVPQSEDNYLAWLSVGMPYSPDELDYLSEGLNGVYRKPKDRDVQESEDTTEDDGSDEMSMAEINQLVAQDTLRKYAQAENLARLADFIPDTSGVKGSVTMNVWNKENTLSQAYEHILRFSQVADIEPDERTKLKIEKLRSLLQTKKIEKDIITDVEEEVIVESPLVTKYNEKMQAYLSAALEYNTHRVNALSGKDPGAVHFWALNAHILRNRVIAAKNDWIANGYKEEYEKIANFISQVQSRNIVGLKAQYQDDLEKARLTGSNSGSDFYYTSLIPGKFAASNQGWTRFTFSSSDYASDYKLSTKSGGGAAGLSLGFFNIGGSGGYDKTTSNLKINTSSFGLEFSIAQVAMVRPWFNSNFLTSKYWRFDQQNPEFKNNMVSDGNKPPQGMIPAYTTTAIFIRDLKMRFAESEYLRETADKTIQGGGFISWGPFNAGGKYKQRDVEKSVESSFDSQGISVDGMQLIGFKCHMMPLSPDPNPDIEKWI